MVFVKSVEGGSFSQGDKLVKLSAGTKSISQTFSRSKWYLSYFLREQVVLVNSVRSSRQDLEHFLWEQIVLVKNVCRSRNEF